MNYYILAKWLSPSRTAGNLDQIYSQEFLATCQFLRVSLVYCEVMLLGSIGT